uniref:HMA domain-containing protein n=1 Tax=Oryza meridionalis TaxID=40149 RepID=A0A0E0EG99_9ORYZ
MASLIIKANLECEKCCKKIQKVLNKLKGKEKIINIVYENSNNRVIISGHFKQEELAHKLRCKACGVIKDIEFVKPEAKKEEKKPDQAKKEEKKPDEKKPEEKKQKAEEKKQEEGKKEEKKEEKPKVKEESKATPAPSSTTVNLQFTNMCGICYPWPCSDPTHWGAGVIHPQWPQSEAPAPAALPAFVPGHHHHQLPPWGGVPAPKWPCGGPSYCGGCVTCRGGGWPAIPAAAAPMQAMCCPGPSSCRGCKGCRIVQEGKFVYEEYPAASACAVM